MVTQTVNDAIGFSKILTEKCKDKVTFRVTGNKFYIYANTKGDFAIIKKWFETSKVQFYTHALAENKLKHMVLRGLPNVNTQDIMSELKKFNLQVVKVVQMKSKSNTTPMSPLYKITLTSVQQISEIRKVKFMCSFSVKWESYHNTNKVTQCYRCQGFGHGMSHCANIPKCVKCLGEHLTNDCKKSTDTKAQCVNCKGEQPANYKKCPTYLEYMGNLQKRQEKYKTKISSSAKDNHQFYYEESQFRTPHIKQQGQHTSSAAHNAAQIPLMSKTFADICNRVQDDTYTASQQPMNELLNLVKSINISLKTCSNANEKLLLMSSCLTNYNKTNNGSA